MGARAIQIALLAMLALPLCGAEIERKDNIRKTFAGATALEVDTVFGGIEVTGYDGSAIQADITRTIRAESEDKAQEAEKDVHLDMRQPDGKALLYVDGPFRCGDGCVHNGGPKHYGYVVFYDFAIKVPRSIKLTLHTVNQGKIRVDGVAGDYDLNSVNGAIEIRNASGSGDVRTVNGPVTGVFQRNPAAKSTFKTLNGTVDVTFQPNLAADLYFKTFNGGIYTDFEVSPLPALQPVAEVRAGRHIYRGNDFRGVRVGAGGPELRFETFNGKILIRRGK